MTSNNRLDIAVEALRQTELRLEDYNQLASNADQRAMALAGTMTAVAALLGALGANTPAPLLTYFCCSVFVLSGILAAASCLPRSFHVRGHYWRDWKGHLDEDDDFFEVITSQAAENDDRLDQNDKALEKAARLTKFSFVLSLWTFCFFVSAQLGALFIQ